MSARGWPTLWLDETPSTMAEARARAHEAPLWIAARRQTAGTGRRGRAWRDPPGNYAATLVLPVAGGAMAMAQRSFVAALAVADACEALGADGIALKWPNDVLMGGAKVAGILLEGLGAGRLAIGVGVNLRAAPAAAEVEARALRPAHLPGDVTQEAFHAAFLPAMRAREEALAIRGFGPTRTAWLARAAGLGAPVTARTPREEVRGTFEGLDETGALLLRTPRGPRVLAAAEVTL